MKPLFVLFIEFVIIFQLNSQPWHYNFGSTTGIFSTSNTVSTTFLPLAPSGTSQIRMSNGGGGSFNLENQIIPFGDNVYLRISGPSNTSVSKFSVYDYLPGKCFTLKFKMRLGNSDGSNIGATAGYWYFFTGDGSSFSDLSNFTNTHSFVGLQLVFGSSGSITTNYRSATVWVPTGLIGTPFTQGVNYEVEIYGNNSTSLENYTYCDTARTVAPNKWDLWINGTLIGDDLNKAGLAANLNIDSWMFYGISCSGNAANIFLDEIDYTNEISPTPLPVKLSYFNAVTSGRNSILRWGTEWEINNAGFEIERTKLDFQSGTITSWVKAGYTRGNGTSINPNSYSYQDLNLSTGEYKYRLKQIDYNGNYEYFNCENTAIIEKPATPVLHQNYPNPSNPKCRISYEIPFDSKVSLKVYDLRGTEVTALVDDYKKADYYAVEFDGTELASGVYCYSLYAEGKGQVYRKTMKMVLVK